MKVTSFALTFALSAVAATAASTAPTSVQNYEGSSLRKRRLFGTPEPEKEESLSTIAYQRMSNRLDKKIASVGGSPHKLNECVKGGMSLTNCLRLQVAQTITPETNEPKTFLEKTKAFIGKPFKKPEEQPLMFERLFGGKSAKPAAALPAAPQKDSDAIDEITKSKHSGIFGKASGLFKGGPPNYFSRDEVLQRAKSDLPSKLEGLKHTRWFYVSAEVVPKPTAIVTLFDRLLAEAHENEITIDKCKEILPKIIHAFTINDPESLDRRLVDIAKQHFGEGDEKMHWTAFRYRFQNLVGLIMQGKLLKFKGNIWDMKEAELKASRML